MKNLIVEYGFNSNVSFNETVNPRELYYRLSESEIFKIADSKSLINGMKLSEAIPFMLKDGSGFSHIGLDDMNKDLQYELFTGSAYNFDGKKTIKDYIERGNVVLAYSDTIKLPTSIPYVIKGDSTVYVNISDFVSMNQYGMVEVTNKRNMNSLMAILFAATVTAKMIISKTKVLASSADGILLMHGNMLSKVITSICHIDSSTKEKIYYLCIQFSLIQAYGTDKGCEIFQRIKMKHVKLSKLVMDALDNSFKIDNYDKLDYFISGLQDMFPIAKKLTMSGLFEKWVKLYGPATAMSIDYIGYQIYNFSMLMFESALIQRLAMESTVNPMIATSTYKVLQSMISDNR